MRPEDASFKQEGFDQHYKGNDINDLAVTVSNDYVCVYTGSTVSSYVWQNL